MASIGRPRVLVWTRQPGRVGSGLGVTTIGHPPQREERTLEILIYPRDLTLVTQRFKELSFTF